MLGPGLRCACTSLVVTVSKFCRYKPISVALCAQCKHWVSCGVEGGCGAGCNSTMLAVGLSVAEHCWGGALGTNWPSCGPPPPPPNPQPPNIPLPRPPAGRAPAGRMKLCAVFKYAGPAIVAPTHACSKQILKRGWRSYNESLGVQGHLHLAAGPPQWQPAGRASVGAQHALGIRDALHRHR